MKKNTLIGFLFLFVFGCASSPTIVIPETSIILTRSNIMSSNNVLINLLAKGQSARFYNELFSESLKESRSLGEFEEEFKGLKRKYGDFLEYPLSYCNELYQPRKTPAIFTLDKPIQVRGLYNFEKRTIFVHLYFIGPEDDLKLGKYVFIED